MSNQEPSVTRDMWAKVRALDTGTKITLGPNTADRYLTDPKRLVFFLSRYKFAAKMLKNATAIVDIGCGDGFGTNTFIADTKASVKGIDFDAELIAHANGLQLELTRLYPEKGARLSFVNGDLLSMVTAPAYDGLSCMDVIEHIEPSRVADFVRNVGGLLKDKGVAVIGTPNLHAKQYASPHSEIGHINDYDPIRLYDELRKEFSVVLQFSMNDEMVHTGFDKLAHYLVAVCIK